MTTEQLSSQKYCNLFKSYNLFTSTDKCSAGFQSVSTCMSVRSWLTVIQFEIEDDFGSYWII